MELRYLLIAVVVLFVAGLLATSSYAKIDHETCVGMWLFDEGQGNKTKDSSGNKNDGTLTNDPEWVDGQLGKALSFDGVDDYVDVGNGASLNLTKSITMAAWVMPLAMGPYDTIIVKKTAYYLVVNSGTIGTYVNATWNFSAKSIVEGEWSHIAVTSDGSDTKFYINGELDSETTGAVAVTANNVQIGGRTDMADRWFTGVIDEVAIFNAVLEEADIQTIMNQGLIEALGLAAVDLSGKLTTTWANIKAR